ncbi:MAG: nucleotidyl transferase AbiEii/AbiGii toxin family protein [Actinobacteria bacterium]|nr:nucleotidyl transferase AbiEii/AbiGii toxin family protein [Actinomycetota bacterium]
MGGNNRKRLFYLSSNPFFKNISIFRGGTALKKIYFPEYRFSEDLDFVLKEKADLRDIDEILNEVFMNISNDFPFKPTKVSSIKNERLQVFVNYEIVPEIKINKELKLDVLKDIFTPSYVIKNIVFTHFDFVGIEKELNAYTLESVVADKILRILDVDKEARDIYDLWFILGLNYLNTDNLKDYFKKRSGFYLQIPNLIDEINSKVYKQTWKIRLENQVLDLPPYESVIEDLKELIGRKLK